MLLAYTQVHDAVLYANAVLHCNPRSSSSVCVLCVLPQSMGAGPYSPVSAAGGRRLLEASEDGDLRNDLRRAESDVDEMRAKLDQLKVSGRIQGIVLLFCHSSMNTVVLPYHY